METNGKGGVTPGTPAAESDVDKRRVQELKAKGKLFGKSALEVKSNESEQRNDHEDVSADDETDLPTAQVPRSDNADTAREPGTEGTTSGDSGTTKSDQTSGNQDMTSDATSTPKTTTMDQTTGETSVTSNSGVQNIVTTRSSASAKTRGGQTATLTTSGSSATTDSVAYSEKRRDTPMFSSSLSYKPSTSSSSSEGDESVPSSKSRSKKKKSKKSKSNKSGMKSGKGKLRTFFKKKKTSRGKSAKSSKMSPSEKASIEETPGRREKRAKHEEAPPPAVDAEQPVGAATAATEQLHDSLPERVAASGMIAEAPVAVATRDNIAETNENAGMAVKTSDGMAAQLNMDSQPGNAYDATAGLQTAVTHTPKRTPSRSRRRSLSRSASRLQISQGCNLVTPLFIRSFQSVRVEPDTDEILITTNVVLHSSGLTVEERKAELDNLIQVRPAVVNVKTMDDDGYQEEKTTQNVLIGKSMIVVERKSTLLRSEQDSGLRTNDTRRYDRICEAKMGPSPDLDPKAEKATGILNVIAENGTSMEGDIYHKTERIVFMIGGVAFSLNDIKTLPSRCEQTASQKSNVKFDERIFADQNSITIDRDTVISANGGALWEMPDTFFVEEKRSYDYQSTYSDGSLVWTNAVPPLKEEETQRSDAILTIEPNLDTAKEPSARKPLPKGMTTDESGREEVYKPKELGSFHEVLTRETEVQKDEKPIASAVVEKHKVTMSSKEDTESSKGKLVSTETRIATKDGTSSKTRIVKEITTIDKLFIEKESITRIKRVGKEGEGSQKQVQEKREFVKEERAVEEPEQFTKPGESLATAKEIERPKVTVQEQQVSTTGEPEKQQRVVKETNIFEKHVSEKEIIESLTTAKEPDGTKVAVQEQQVSTTGEPKKQQRVVKETNIFEKHVSEKEIIESLTTAKEPDGTKVAVQEQQVSTAREPEKQQRVAKETNISEKHESLTAAKEPDGTKVAVQEQQVSTAREPEKQQRVVKETNIYEKHVSEKEIRTDSAESKPASVGHVSRVEERTGSGIRSVSKETKVIEKHIIEKVTTEVYDSSGEPRSKKVKEEKKEEVLSTAKEPEKIEIPEKKPILEEIVWEKWNICPAAVAEKIGTRRDCESMDLIPVDQKLVYDTIGEEPEPATQQPPRIPQEVELIPIEEEVFAEIVKEEPTPAIETRDQKEPEMIELIPIEEEKYCDTVKTETSCSYVDQNLQNGPRKADLISTDEKVISECINQSLITGEQVPLNVPQAAELIPIAYSQNHDYICVQLPPEAEQVRLKSPQTMDLIPYEGCESREIVPECVIPEIEQRPKVELHEVHLIPIDDEEIHERDKVQSPVACEQKPLKEKSTVELIPIGDEELCEVVQETLPNIVQVCAFEKGPLKVDLIAIEEEEFYEIIKGEEPQITEGHNNEPQKSDLIPIEEEEEVYKPVQGIMPTVDQIPTKKPTSVDLIPVTDKEIEDHYSIRSPAAREQRPPVEPQVVELRPIDHREISQYLSETQATVEEIPPKELTNVDLIPVADKEIGDYYDTRSPAAREQKPSVELQEVELTPFDHLEISDSLPVTQPTIEQIGPRQPEVVDLILVPEEEVADQYYVYPSAVPEQICSRQPEVVELMPIPDGTVCEEVPVAQPAIEQVCPKQSEVVELILVPEEEVIDQCCVYPSAVPEQIYSRQPEVVELMPIPDGTVCEEVPVAQPTVEQVCPKQSEVVELILVPEEEVIDQCCVYPSAVPEQIYSRQPEAVELIPIPDETVCEEVPVTNPTVEQISSKQPGVVDLIVVPEEKVIDESSEYPFTVVELIYMRKPKAVELIPIPDETVCEEVPVTNPTVEEICVKRSGTVDSILVPDKEVVDQYHVCPPAVSEQICPKPLEKLTLIEEPSVQVEKPKDVCTAKEPEKTVTTIIKETKIFEAHIIERQITEVDNSCTKTQNEKSERLKKVKTIEEDLRTAKETEKPTQIVSVRESTKDSASSANESVSKETVIREKHVFEKIVREVEDSGPPKEVLSTAKEAEKSQISSEHLKEVKNIEEDVHTAKEIEKPTQTVSVSESGKESLNTARQSVSKETRIVEKHVFEKTVKDIVYYGFLRSRCPTITANLCSTLLHPFFIEHAPQPTVRYQLNDVLKAKPTATSRELSTTLGCD
ncbi:hypothetical protein RB195_017096 [Necator americanus]|uniref:Uncharacterized protein n=1 Tax=Necator americanus TaxID=51031 RepID=A0ABR1C3K9_NECAM